MVKPKLDEYYQDSMLEHLKELREEMAEYRSMLPESGSPSMMLYRAIERTMQLLIEACIGIAKQGLKASGKEAPSDARKAFEKIKAMGLDHTEADWNRIIGMRNALVHDYLNLDPEKVLAVVRKGQHEELFSFAFSVLED